MLLDILSASVNSFKLLLWTFLLMFEKLRVLLLNLGRCLRLLFRLLGLRVSVKRLNLLKVRASRRSK